MIQYNEYRNIITFINIFIINQIFSLMYLCMYVHESHFRMKLEVIYSNIRYIIQSKVIFILRTNLFYLVKRTVRLKVKEAAAFPFLR